MRQTMGIMLGGALLLVGGNALAGGKAGAMAPAPREVEFKAEVDRSVEKYVEILPPGYDAGKPCDLLIALHGHGSDRWQYIRDGRGECKAARDVAAKRGMIFLSPDYRGTTSWMGPKAEADLVQIIRELRNTRNIGRVFLVGGSMGGTSVLIFAVLHPDLVDGVSSQNGTANMLEYANFQDAIMKSYGGTKTEKPDEYRKRSAELFPEKLRGIPMAFTTGGRDTAVPPDSTLRLARKLQEMDAGKVLLIHRPEQGHSTDYADTAKALEFVIDQADKVKNRKKGAK
jgi:dipeptidyl aminopeptidase/acylaminoacyl peptidase